jgi:hypothetical protein
MISWSSIRPGPGSLHKLRKVRPLQDRRLCRLVPENPESGGTNAARGEAAASAPHRTHRVTAADDGAMALCPRSVAGQPLRQRTWKRRATVWEGRLAGARPMSGQEGG